ncbi:DUF3253 domain-containing protein [Sphingomonas naasensis]
MTIDVASVAVVRLLAERASGATMCPSEVARKIAGEASGMMRRIGVEYGEHWRTSCAPRSEIAHVQIARYRIDFVTSAALLRHAPRPPRRSWRCRSAGLPRRHQPH